jgi:Mg-chelatase subunit ChlD
VLLTVNLMATCVAILGTDDQSANSEPVDEDVAAYQSEVFEGVGASVAVLVDTSGSMDEQAPGSVESKATVARAALHKVLAATDAFVAKRPEFPIKLGIWGFASSPYQVMPMQPYSRDAVSKALDSIPGPGGGTGIGEAMLAARPELYRSGTFRKYILVLTDGENTSGRDPEKVARAIYEKSQKVVEINFVAFDVDPTRFGFVTDVGGEVVAASDAAGLEGALHAIYEGRILAEAVDYGETAEKPGVPQAGGGNPDPSR